MNVYVVSLLEAAEWLTNKGLEEEEEDETAFNSLPLVDSLLSRRFSLWLPAVDDDADDGASFLSYNDASNAAALSMADCSILAHALAPAFFATSTYKHIIIVIINHIYIWREHERTGVCLAVLRAVYMALFLARRINNANVWMLSSLRAARCNGVLPPFASVLVVDAPFNINHSHVTA